MGVEGQLQGPPTDPPIGPPPTGQPPTGPGGTMEAGIVVLDLEPGRSQPSQTATGLSTLCHKSEDRNLNCNNQSHALFVLKMQNI